MNRLDWEQTRLPPRFWPFNLLWRDSPGEQSHEILRWLLRSTISASDVRMTADLFQWWMKTFRQRARRMVILNESVVHCRCIGSPEYAWGQPVTHQLLCSALPNVALKKTRVSQDLEQGVAGVPDWDDPQTGINEYTVPLIRVLHQFSAPPSNRQNYHILSTAF